MDGSALESHISKIFSNDNRRFLYLVFESTEVF